MTNRWATKFLVIDLSLIALISHWFHLLLISISSRGHGCKRIWRLPVMVVQFCNSSITPCDGYFLSLYKAWRAISCQCENFVILLKGWSSSFPFSCKAEIHNISIGVLRVPYQCFENHLWLALYVSTSRSTGTSDTRKNASDTDKRITNEKEWYKKGRKASYACKIIVDGLRLLIDYSLMIANNRWLIKWLLVEYSLITNWCHWSSISYVWISGWTLKDRKN